MTRHIPGRRSTAINDSYRLRLVATLTIRLVTFDLDDTLWDVAPVLERAEALTYAWLVDHCPDAARQFSIAGLREWKQQLVASCPELQHRISAARVASIVAALLACGYRSHEAHALAGEAFEVFLEARHQVELFESAEEAVAALARKFTLGVLTNGNADIRRMPIGRHFRFSFSAEQVGASKPAGAIFHAAAAHSGACATEIVHVGDHRINDIEGAARLGWHTVWVNLQGEPWSDGETPTVTIRHLGELPAAIQRISDGKF